MRPVAAAVCALLSALLVGCVTSPKPVPEGYTGPTATLKDSALVKPGDICGAFFFLHEYEGKQVDNVIQASARDNAGMGPVISLVHEFSRPVPARPATFFIAGRTHCGAPIAEMLGTVYLVGGKVSFAPEADATYVIRGELLPDHSSVWIAEEKSGRQVSTRLTIQGMAKEGFFGIKGKVEETPPPPAE